MNFTDQKMGEINATLAEMKKNYPYELKVGISLCDSIGGAHILKDGMAFCSIDDLGGLIEELQMLRAAIKKESGVIL